MHGVLLWDALSELYHTGHATLSNTLLKLLSSFTNYLRRSKLRANCTHPEIDAGTRARSDIGDYFWDIDYVASTSWIDGARTGGT